LKEIQNIDESFMNPELGEWEKIMGICLVLVNIAGHHPGFSVILGLNIVLAFSLPVAGKVVHIKIKTFLHYFRFDILLLPPVWKVWK
jgi:hypothetical protein